MGAWVGPAIVAALISGVISLIGLYLGGWIAIRHEKRRRREKVRDFQVALRAEIRSELHNLMSVDFDEHFAEIEARYASSPDYSVYPSYPARQPILSALESEIHILPGPVIDAVTGDRDRPSKGSSKTCVANGFPGSTRNASLQCIRIMLV